MPANFISLRQLLITSLAVREIWQIIYHMSNSLFFLGFYNIEVED
ncbi:hypothetical protein MicvaDRAFT_1595 [Microcoleus vaginatus FGP-2]|nr:hypothetical protein MicvaDRAFT_1595 [Microcoleus vaginatus FGP-2]